MPYREFSQPEVRDRALINASVVAHQHIDPFQSHSGRSHGADKKKLSYKIDSSKAPFAKDQEAIGRNTDQALSLAMSGQDPEAFNQHSEQISNLSQAHKGELDQQAKQVNELQQTYKNAIDPTPVQKLHNEAYDHDYTSRGEVLQKGRGEINNPVNMFKRDTHLQNLFSNNDIFPTQNIEYNNKRELGDTTTDAKRKVVGKLLVDDTTRPVIGLDGKQEMSNGRPLYEKRNVQSVSDVEPTARQMLNDPFYKNMAIQQVANENRDVVEKQSKAWADKWKDDNGDFPTKEAIDANKQGIAERLAVDDVSKKLLQMERGYTTGSGSKTLDEPRHVTQKDRDNKVLVSKPQLDQTRYGYHDKLLGRDDIQTIATTTFTKSDGAPYKFSVPDIRGKDEKGNFIPLNSAMGKAEIVDAHLVPLTGGDGSGVPTGYKNWPSYLKSNPHSTHYVGGNIVLKIPRSKQELNSLGLTTEIMNKAEKAMNDPNLTDEQRQAATNKYFELDSKATFKATVPFDKIKSQIYSATGGQIKSISDIFGKDLVDSKAKELSDAQKAPRKVIQSGPAKVTTQAQYDALPKGTRYVDSKGNPAVKK